MRTAIHIALATLVPGAAAALSCLPPDPVALYERARDAEESYYVVAGRIEVPRDLRLPAPDDGRPAETPVRIAGQVLSRAGFAPGFDRDAVLRLTCSGPWCAPAPDDGPVIAAVRIEDGALVLEVDACSSTIVPGDAAARAAVEACHRDGDCPRPEY